MSNINEKDWQLYNSVEKGEQNISDSLPNEKLMTDPIERKTGANLSILD